MATYTVNYFIKRNHQEHIYERTEIEAKSQPCVIYAVHKRK